MKFKFIPVDFDSFDFEGRNYIRLIGRTASGKRVCVIDDYEPNFYVILKETGEKRIKGIIQEIEKIKIERLSRVSKVEKVKVEEKNFLGKKVKALRVYVTNHKDAHEIASKIGDVREIEARREYDVALITKYIKESGVEPLETFEVEASPVGLDDFGGIASSLEIDTIVYAKNFKKLKEEKFSPKVLAFDIEATNMDASKGEALMISLYSKNFKKVLTWKNPPGKQEFVEVFKNESEMLNAFVKEVKKFAPDILTGYFSDGFDLPFLTVRAKKNKVNFNLGLDGKPPFFNRARIPSGRVSGIVHVDIYRFVSAVFSQYLQSETLSLGEVAGELVGETKEDFDFEKLSNMKDKDWIDFFSYNLQDSKVTYKLFEKIWPDIFEFCKITKEPLFEVTRNRMAGHVENFIIHNLDRFDEVVEKKPVSEEIGRRRGLGKYEGAFVYEPKPGLYEDLVFFDFTSMYASVIVSYNLSLSTYEGKEKFSKKKGFFPELLSEIIEKRKKHKIEYSKSPSGMLRARSNAYKLLANASYGYQGFFGARYYSREAAAATTKFARENIHSAIKKIKDEGYEIIYSDTDSIAFLRGNKSKKEILKFLEKINSKLPGIMELDLEDFYKRGLFVSTRGTTKGAKKKYALINENGEPKIRGFETVRRDWCNLARALQNKIIESVLINGNERESLDVLKQVVEELKERRIELKDLIIRTQLRRPIGEYVSEGPHVDYQIL